MMLQILNIAKLQLQHVRIIFQLRMKVTSLFRRKSTYSGLLSRSFLKAGGTKILLRLLDIAIYFQNKRMIDTLAMKVSFIIQAESCNYQLV